MEKEKNLDQEKLKNTIKELKQIKYSLEMMNSVLNLFNTTKIPFILCFIDSNTLQILKISKSCIPIFGYPPDKMEGEIYSKFVSEDDFKRGVQNIKKIRNNEKIESYHINSYILKDKTKIQMVWFWNYFNDQSDKIFCIGIPNKLLQKK